MIFCKTWKPICGQQRAAADGTAKVAPSEGALRALLPLHNQLGETSTSKTLSQTALTSRNPWRTLNHHGLFCVCLESTRALENRGPEEFTLRTASGGENNPKVKGRHGLFHGEDVFGFKKDPVPTKETSAHWRRHVSSRCEGAR